MIKKIMKEKLEIINHATIFYETTSTTIVCVCGNHLLFLLEHYLLMFNNMRIMQTNWQLSLGITELELELEARTMNMEYQVYYLHI